MHILLLWFSLFQDAYLCQLTSAILIYTFLIVPMIVETVFSAAGVWSCLPSTVGEDREGSVAHTPHSFIIDEDADVDESESVEDEDNENKHYKQVSYCLAQLHCLHNVSTFLSLRYAHVVVHCPKL